MVRQTAALALTAQGEKRENLSFCARRRPGAIAGAACGRRDWPSPRRQQKRQARTGDNLNSISYLPATFTTLFFLAASLLLGLM